MRVRSLHRSASRIHEGPMEGSAFDVASERFARGLASRITRRSFLGDVAKAGMALAVAGGVVGFAGVEEAEATHCGGCASCTPSLSITCRALTGTNACPDGSCRCGWWDVAGGPCGDCTRWHDCCFGCGGSGTCRHNDQGECAPTCCNRKDYCGGCGTRFQTRIKCRMYTCPSGCTSGDTSCS
jgi:hypothetical protein